VRLTAGTTPAGQKDSMADHLAGLPTMSRLLDHYPYVRYHDCSRCFFLVLPQRQRPRRNRLTAIMEVFPTLPTPEKVRSAPGCPKS
jgi:hypothetical protein